MPRKPKQGTPPQALTPAAESPLLHSMLLSPSQERLAEAAAAIRQQPPTTDELAYMARQLILCTLPHRDPGDVPLWTRTNGSLTLVIARTAYDAKTGKPIGYPFGSVPRLLLFWLTAEAVRTNSRRIELGDSLAGFMDAIGLHRRSGTGRGDAYRVREQIRRLFGASIGFQGDSPGREQRVSMLIVEEADLWWDPKRPKQTSLWRSSVELGQRFFDAITAAPVPLDLRALKALKRSPLALDLYAAMTYRAFVARRKGLPIFIGWGDLEDQLGADYDRPKDFRQKIRAALRKVQAVYPDLKTQTAEGGLLVLPDSCPAVPIRPRRRVQNS